MVKYICKSEDSELSTSQSLFTENDVPLVETLSNLIERVPKLTTQQRRQTIRLPHSSKGHSRKWSQNQTKQFYQLLCHFGLDFTLISYHPLFHNKRSQKELSNKYKKELKSNPGNINNILNKIDQEGLYRNGCPSNHQ